MHGERERATVVGAALNGAVEVCLNERGRVVGVRLHPRIARQVGPDQLGRAVVAAHADARAAASGA